MSELVDLTITLHPKMPGVDWETARTLDLDGWNARTLHLYSHCGTHMDAPLHFGCGDNATIDKTPLSVCLSTAIKAQIDVEPSGLIEIEDLGKVTDLIGSGQSLLLQTGWSQYRNQPSMYRDQLPRVSARLAAWCCQRKLKVLGVEPPSVANVNDLPEVTEIHRILLGGGVTIVEGLTNLESLPTGRPFLFGAMPLKILEGDGAPCRAFASLQDLEIETE